MMPITETASSLDLHIDSMLPSRKVLPFRSKLQERRNKTRINERFPARIWGDDQVQTPLNMEGTLDNISATGLYLKACKSFDAGSEVRIIVQLFSGQTSGVTASVQGRILRSELHTDGKYGMAVAISRSRFI